MFKKRENIAVNSISIPTTETEMQPEFEREKDSLIWSSREDSVGKVG